MKRNFIWKTLFVLALIFGAGLWWGALHIAPYAIVCTQRRVKPVPLADYAGSRKFEVEAADGIKIACAYLPTPLKPCRGRILVLHGIQDCMGSQMGAARFFLNHNFDVVLMDHRAHGESGGRFATYGYLEKEDNRKVTDAMGQLPGGPLSIGAYGASYGGSVLLQTLPLEPRIRFAIVESVFSSMREVVYSYLGVILKFKAHIVSDAVLDRAAKMAHFNPDEVNPAEALSKASQPVLYIYGEEDRNMPENQRKILRGNLHVPGSRHLAVKGANHYNVWQVAGKEYDRAMLEFLAEQAP